MKNGDTKATIKNYKKALYLNKNNKNACKIIEELKVKT